MAAGERLRPGAPVTSPTGRAGARGVDATLVSSFARHSPVVVRGPGARGESSTGPHRRADDVERVRPRDRGRRDADRRAVEGVHGLSLIHISEPTRLLSISYA